MYVNTSGYSQYIVFSRLLQVSNRFVRDYLFENVIFDRIELRHFCDFSCRQLFFYGILRLIIALPVKESVHPEGPMSKKKLIMIADDERGIHESLRMYLAREGYDVYSVFRGDDVMEAFEQMQPDLIILDIMMPGRSGTQLCADIRAVSMTPIIILTAKGEEVDKLLGFALGADDYIVKPFSPREIVSRIQVIFRRMNQLLEEPTHGKLTIGNTVIDLKCYEVLVNGERVTLSPKEVEILHLMAKHPRQVFTREQLLDNIWGFDFNGDPRVVDTSIKRIRKKLPPDTDIQLKSVYGVGYKAEVEHA